MDESDRQLIARARAELPHQTRAFEQLAQRNYPYVRKLALGIVGRTDDADSVAQDVMLRVFHGLPKLKAAEAFPGWLRQIIVNTSRTWLMREKRERDKGRRLALEPDLDHAAPSARSAREGFGALIDGLPAEERAILAFRFVDELEFNQIAEIMDLGLSATKMRYYRAIERMKQRVAQAAED
jgi:RNA polymerase sigma-70 factor (ECF subfamily)